MNNRPPLPRDVPPHEIHHLVVLLVGSAKFLTCVFIFNFGLLGLDAGECVCVSEIEVFAFAEGAEADCVRVVAVEFGEG